jgi:hypothetical protein
MARKPLPPARNVGQAIEGSASLASLLAGHRRAQDCFAAVRRLLPFGLDRSVRAGPIQDGQWTLFAQNGAVAAKLRQALPTLLQAVQAREPEVRELRVKILPKEV